MKSYVFAGVMGCSVAVSLVVLAGCAAGTDRGGSESAHVESKDEGRKPVEFKEGMTKQEKLYLAAEMGTLAQVRELVEDGASLEAYSDDGMTALMYAASNNEDPEVCRYLVGSGASIE